METPTPHVVIPLPKRVLFPVNSSAVAAHPVWRGPTTGWPGREELFAQIGSPPDVISLPSGAAAGASSVAAVFSQDSTVTMVDISGACAARHFDGESSPFHQCSCVQCAPAFISGTRPDVDRGGGREAVQPAPPSQRCVFGCGGLLVKERGECAVRWHCLRCGATAVDEAPATPASFEHINTWSVEACLPHARVQLCPHTGSALVYIGSVLCWSLPLALAAWLRYAITEIFGTVSETVCAAGTWLWLERSSGRWGSEALCSGPRPWRWQWDPGDSACTPSWSTSTASGVAHPGAWCPWPAILATNDPVGSSGCSGLRAQGECGPADDGGVHGLSDAAFFGAVVSSAAPSLDIFSVAEGAVFGAPSKQSTSLDAPSERQLARAWTLRLWMWVCNSCRVVPSEEECSARVPRLLPWPVVEYVPPPLWDRTARVHQDESRVGDSMCLSPYTPLLAAPVDAGVTALAVHRWSALLKGAAQWPIICTGLQWGFPLMVSPERAVAGAELSRPASSPQERSAIDAFITKSVRLGHVRDVSAEVRVPVDCAWVAPFVTVAKAGEPGAFRVCHDASAAPRVVGSARGPAAVSLVSLNGDADFSPISPVTLLYLEWVLQRYRFLCAMYPGQPIFGWKMDAKHWYRQVPTRRREQHWLLQRWGGRLFAHTVFSFGLKAAMHICGVLSNALADVVMLLFAIVVRVFVDDVVCLEVGPRAKWSMHAVRTLGTFLGWMWNPDKDVHPTSRLPILGVEFDLHKGKANILPERRLQVATACRQLLQLARDGLPTTVGVLQELAGVCTFLSAVVPFGKAHTIEWYRLAGSIGVAPRDDPRHLTAEAVLALQWWLHVMEDPDGAVPTQPMSWGVQPGSELVPVHRGRVDAAGGIGFGALVEAKGAFVLAGTWCPIEKLFSNNVLECAAAAIVLATCAPLCSGGVMVLETDNTCTMWCLRKCSARNPVLRWLAMFVWALQERFRFLLRVSHCSGRRLVGADAVSRGRDVWSEGLLPPVRGSAWVSLAIPSAARRLGPVGSELLRSNASLARSSAPKLACDTSRVSEHKPPLTLFFSRTRVGAVVDAVRGRRARATGGGHALAGHVFSQLRHEVT